MTQNDKICHICEKANSIYKCPTCRIPYCSLACNKIHKAEPCSPPKPIKVENKVTETKYDFLTEDTVPISKLQLLQGDEEIKKCLKNHHVRNIIKTVVSSNNPTEAIALAMKEPIFVELADACIKIIEPSENTEST